MGGVHDGLEEIASAHTGGQGHECPRQDDDQDDGLYVGTLCLKVRTQGHYLCIINMWCAKIG